MKIVVSAGPTREFIDPVRFLSNPSSGLTGFAVAAAAARRGCETVLVSGPGVALPTPEGVRRVDVVSARDMCRAIVAEIEGAGGPAALIMTAAVADWRPETCATAKMKKSDAVQSATLKLVRNPDILKTVSAQYAAKKDLVLVGFAAETGDPAAEAIRKCREKHLHMVVGNDVSRAGCGFASATNEVVFAFPDGRVERLEKMPKSALAEAILEKVCSLEFAVCSCRRGVPAAKPAQARKLQTANSKLVLASASPRRAKILAGAGYEFEVVKTQAREITRPHDPEGTVLANAAAKWRAAKAILETTSPHDSTISRFHDSPILAADTIVWMDGRIFGKPRDLEEAKAFLRILSGRTHTVFTGVAIGCGDEPRLACVKSDVVFKRLSEDVIESYVDAVRPVDRAGAYDIDVLGELLIDHYTGSRENIMGLPVEIVES